MSCGSVPRARAAAGIFALGIELRQGSSRLVRAAAASFALGSPGSDLRGWFELRQRSSRSGSSCGSVVRARFELWLRLGRGRWLAHELRTRTALWRAVVVPRGRSITRHLAVSVRGRATETSSSANIPPTSASERSGRRRCCAACSCWLRVPAAGRRRTTMPSLPVRPRRAGRAARPPALAVRSQLKRARRPAEQPQPERSRRPAELVPPE